MTDNFILKEAGIDGAKRVFVDPIIIHNKGILNIHRRKDLAKYPDCWCLPGGGVDFGEDLETALKRETLEELGLEVISAELVQDGGKPFYWDSAAPDGDGFWLGVYFVVKVAGTPKLMEPDKHDGLEYVRKESLRNYYPGEVSDLSSAKYRGELKVWDLVDLNFESLID